MQNLTRRRPPRHRAIAITVLAAAIAIPYAHRANAQTPHREALLSSLNLPAEIKARAALAAADPVTFDRELKAFLVAQPQIKGYQRGAKNRRETIDDYEAGVLRLGLNEPVEFKLPLDWKRTDRGLNYLRELHSLRFLNNFAREYQESGDTRYLDIVDSALQDWISKNPLDEHAENAAWYEGAVSKRLLALLNLLDVYQTIEQPRQISIAMLLELIQQHAGWLMNDRTYPKNSNHGMRQDLALVAASVRVSFFTRAPQWRSHALQRLRYFQIEVGFSREGVWREHSPGYHDYVMNLLDDFFELAQSGNLGDEVAFLRELDAKSQFYYAHVLTPCGNFPPVGDTGEDKPSLRDMRDPAARFTATAGKEGSPSPQLDGFFPDAGEVIFRDAWTREHLPGGPDGAADQALYVHMHAADHPPAGHRHQDDLSFVMHGLGRWWILEGGKYGYDNDQWRHYIVSAQAHNGVTFENQALDSLDRKNPEKTVAFDPSSVSTPAIAAARAYTSRFPVDGVRVTRTYVLLRDRRTLVLLDQFEAPKVGEWQSYVHLTPDARCAPAPGPGPDGVTVSVPTHEQARLHVLFEQSGLAGLEIECGKKDPMLGWYSPEFRKVVANHVIIARRRCKTGMFATLIKLSEGGDASAGRGQPQQLQTTQRGDAAVISWTESGQGFSLEIGLSSPLRIGFRSPQTTLTATQ